MSSQPASIVAIFTVALISGDVRAQEAIDPFWSGQSPNAWLYPTASSSPVSARVGPTYAMTESAQIGANLVTFALLGGGSIGVALATPAAVLTNRVLGSAPALPGGPPMTVTGWGTPAYRESGGVFLNTSNPADPSAPIVRLSPGSGTYTRTFSVVFDIVSLAPITSVGIRLTDYNYPGGQVTQSFGTSRGVIGPLPGGTSMISWNVVAGGQAYSGSALYEVSIPFTVETLDPSGSGTRPIFLDSDGDGIPDAIELAYGGNPNVADLDKDTDGDGWSDFDEFLRGSDPRCDGAPPCTPLDSDGDGWSDWDEVHRGTETNAANCRPAAQGLYEIEVRANGVVHDLDLDGGGAVTTIGSFDIRGLDGGPRTLQRANGCELGFVPGVPPHLPFMVADLSFRIGAGTWALTRSTGPAHTVGPDGPVQTGAGWVAKAFIPARGHLTAIQVLGFIDPAGITDAASFRDAWGHAFAALAVQPFTGVASPRTVPPAALLAELIGWEADRGDDYRPVLGLATADRYPQAFDAVRRRAGDFGGLVAGLAMLYADPSNDLSLGGPLAAFGAALADVGDDPIDITHTPSDLERYAARVLHVSGHGRVFALEPWERAILFDPARDFDGDGLPSRDEVLDRPVGSGREAVRAIHATDPMMADTDGDGFDDRLDPCPLDATDECRILAATQRDSDGDKILDPLDNCLHVANANQLDSDGDGIGDACSGLVSIVEPRYHPVARTGTFLRLRSQATAAGLAASNLTYRWTFDGLAPDAVVAQPPDVLLDKPGTYRIELWVASNGQSLALADHRDLVVFGPSRSVGVAIAFVGDLIEGHPIRFTATTSEPVDLTWEMGDGSTATGDAVTHTYAHDGARRIVVDARAPDGRIGVATLDLTIADSVPQAAFTWSVNYPTVRVTNTSTSWDPIVAATWNFGDRTPIVSSHNATHTYAAPGDYLITLTVVDDDGSVATVAHWVSVQAPPITLTSATLSTQWKTFALRFPMADPLLFPSLVSPYEGVDPQNPRRKILVTPPPGVVRLSNVTSTTFEARFEPFVARSAAVTPLVAVLAVERGVHTFADGSRWQADSLPLAGSNSDFVQETLGVVSPLIPTLMSALQTASDPVLAGTRIRAAGASSFEIALMQTHLRATRVHGEEDAAFLAIWSPDNRGDIPIANSLVAWSASLASLTTRTRNWSGCKVALVADPSDGDTAHGAEDAWILKIGKHCFGMVVTMNDPKPVVVQGR